MTNNIWAHLFWSVSRRGTALLDKGDIMKTDEKFFHKVQSGHIVQTFDGERYLVYKVKSKHSTNSTRITGYEVFAVSQNSSAVWTSDGNRVRDYSPKILYADPKSFSDGLNDGLWDKPMTQVLWRHYDEEELQEEIQSLTSRREELKQRLSELVELQRRQQAETS